MKLLSTLILPAVSLGLPLSLSNCGLFSDPGLTTNPFKSRITYDLSPTNDTLRACVDTLWLSCTFSDTFLDVSGKKTLTFSNDLRFIVGIEEVKFGLIGDPAMDYGAYYQSLKFDFIPVVGDAEHVKVGCKISPTFLNGTYSLKVGIVPKEEGLFFLEDIGGKPTTTDVNMILYQSFNVKDCNVDLIPGSFPRVQKMVQGYVDNPSFVVKNRAYCFYVKK